MAACERSLRRLRTDRLDLYLLHGRGSTPLAETLEAFAELVDQGHPDRLALAEQIGAIAVDDSKTDPVQFVMDQTKGRAQTGAVSAWASRRTTRRATKTRP